MLDPLELEQTVVSLLLRTKPSLATEPSLQALERLSQADIHYG